MYRLITNIFLVLYVALPAWSSTANIKTFDYINWDKWDKSTATLYCDTTANDTTWSLSLEGYVDNGYLLLMRSGDGKVITLKPYERHFESVTDSIGRSPITGEFVEYTHLVTVLYYHISVSDLNHIAEHGIVKLRCGNDVVHRDKVYRHNEFGKQLTDAYRQILKELSPDYVPPKKTSIFDGF